MTTLGPDARFEVTTTDVEYLRHGNESLLATVYQPQGAGPFPALLEVHGVQWSSGTRTMDAVLNQAVAAGGIVVAAIDFRLAPAHRYPAQVQDIHYGIRWLKANAARFNADPATVGGLGTSSGGHGIVLSAMRPYDLRYRALPLTGAPGATRRCVTSSRAGALSTHGRAPSSPAPARGPARVSAAPSGCSTVGKGTSATRPP